MDDLLLRLQRAMTHEDFSNVIRCINEAGFYIFRKRSPYDYIFCLEVTDKYNNPIKGNRIIPNDAYLNYCVNDGRYYPKGRMKLRSCKKYLSLCKDKKG